MRPTDAHTSAVSAAELEELEQRVADRTAELRERAERHLAVLNELAHEVRTPLAAAAGMLELVLTGDDGLSQGTREEIAIARSAITEALRIVSDQLDRARIETGGLPLACTDVELGRELSLLRDGFRALAAPDVSLVVEPDGDPVVVRTDAILLGHVLRNLLGNALKFTDHGEVRLRARQMAGGAAEIDVTDTGVGIAPADQQRIFRPWQQVAAAQRGRASGSGLGLPLVRELVERLGGSISLQSTPGGGSTFTLWLPSAPPAS